MNTQTSEVCISPFLKKIVACLRYSGSKLSRNDDYELGDRFEKVWIGQQIEFPPGVLKINVGNPSGCWCGCIPQS